MWNFCKTISLWICEVASYAYVRKDFWRNVRDWVRNMHSTLPLKLTLSKKATKLDEIFIVNLTLCSKCQIDGEDLVNFCDLLGKHELYNRTPKWDSRIRDTNSIRFKGISITEAIWFSKWNFFKQSFNKILDESGSAKFREGRLTNTGQLLFSTCAISMDHLFCNHYSRKM